MSPLIPFVVFAAAFAVLVVWLGVRNRAQRAARALQLQRMGFAPCPGEARALEGRISSLENNAEYRYSIEDPLRAALGVRAAYFYTKMRRRQGSIVAAHEFLHPLTRPSAEGLVLFFKPSDLRPGTTATLIGRLATSGWDSRPDDLTPLEIPIDLQQTNLIGALGPAGASLFELIDPKSLALLQLVADSGASTVTCRGDWCSLSSGSTRIDLDLGRLWPLVQQLSSHG